MKPLYENNFLEKEEADSIFESLMKLEWLSVTEARKEYFMSTEPRGYLYGKGLGAREYLSKPFLKEVDDIRNKLNLAGNVYDICFCNRYDTQKNQLGWHSDDTMDDTHPIAVISFGAEREIWWRKIGDKGVVPLENRQKLAHGSLFVMPAGFQTTHQHRIPKCDRDCGIRISLTFRKYKD